MTTRKVERPRGLASPEGASLEGAPLEGADVDVEVDAKPSARATPAGERIGGTPEHDRSAVHERTAHGALASQSRSGRYVLAFELASGGMATVFLARFEGAAGFSRPVALKRIHMHLSRDRRFVDMFLDEARISARLTHPNVCAVQDFGQDEEGGYYLAMEYLAGETLAKVARAALRANDRAPTDPRYRRLVAHLLAEACEGLHAAHEARDADGAALEIVHRDVTPNNLFVTFDGVVKVVDFGIAKARDRVTQTDTGEFKGSLPYISPEHALSRESDRRADIWSLGVCAWELYAGRRLFKRQTPAETLYAVLEDSVPRVDEAQPTVPSGYADAIERALRRDAALRYPTARELGQALALASEVDGPRPSAGEISAWLDELFPGARDARRTLVERTLRADAGAPVGPDARRTVEGAGTHRRPSERSPARLALMLGLVAVTGGVSVWMFGGTDDEAAGTRRAIDALEDAAGPATPRPVAIDPITLAPLDLAAPVVLEGPAATTAVEPAVPHGARPRHRDRSPDPTPAATTDPVREVRAEAPSRAGAGSESAPGTARESGDRSTGDGTVVVVVPDGWGEVYDGARRLGQTPLRTTLSAGGHDLEVRIEGHAPGRRVHADVRAGETTRLVVRAGE